MDAVIAQREREAGEAAAQEEHAANADEPSQKD